MAKGGRNTRRTRMQRYVLVMLTGFAIASVGTLFGCDQSNEREVSREVKTKVESDGDMKKSTERTTVNTDTGEVTKTKTEQKTDVDH
jgi:hypothetical protein